MIPPVTTVEGKDKSLGKGASGIPPLGPRPPGDGIPVPHNSRPVPAANLFRIAMYGILVAVSMTFFVLCSAYVYLVAQPHAWKPIRLPVLVWTSTALILASSFCLSAVRREFNRGIVAGGRIWLYAALALGAGFLFSQLGAWYQLSLTGLFEAGNQQRSFFLILSITHGAHVVAGLLGLVYLATRAYRDRPSVRFPLSSAVKTIGLFWHAMTVIWLFVLALLLIWK